MLGFSGISYAGITRHVIGEGGIRALWSGLSASTIRTVPGMGLYFVALDTLQRAIPTKGPKVCRGHGRGLGCNYSLTSITADITFY